MKSCISSITDSAEKILDEVAEAVCKQNETDFIMSCYRNFIVNKKLVAEFNAFIFKESVESQQFPYVLQLKSDNFGDYHIPDNL